MRCIASRPKVFETCFAEHKFNRLYIFPLPAAFLHFTEQDKCTEYGYGGCNAEIGHGNRAADDQKIYILEEVHHDLGCCAELCKRNPGRKEYTLLHRSLGRQFIILHP